MWQAGGQDDRESRLARSRKNPRRDYGERRQRDARILQESAGHGRSDDTRRMDEDRRHGHHRLRRIHLSARTQQDHAARPLRTEHLSRGNRTETQQHAHGQRIPRGGQRRWQTCGSDISGLRRSHPRAAKPRRRQEADGREHSRSQHNA